MSRPFIVIAVLFACAVNLTGFASSSTASVPSQQEAASSSQAPSPVQTAPSTPIHDSAKPGPKKTKKVWTNDNLADSGGTISVVGDPENSSKPKTKAAPDRSAADKAYDTKQIRQALLQLEAQLASADKRLNELKNLSKGDAKGTGGLKQQTWSYNSSSIDEQIRDLQQRKNEIQAAIDEVLDFARKVGIEPGQLR